MTRLFLGLALAASLALTSCDAVLETFYPDFKNGYDNQKNATIKVFGKYIGSNGLGSNPVHVMAVPIFDMGDGFFYPDAGNYRSTVSTGSFPTGWYGVVTNPPFADLTNAKWEVLAFVDLHGTSVLESDDPSVLAEMDQPGSGRAVIDLRYHLKDTLAYLTLDDSHQTPPEFDGLADY